MVRYEAEIPDGQRLANASDGSGAYRGNLHDSKTGRLVGQAKFREVEDDYADDQRWDTSPTAPPEPDGEIGLVGLLALAGGALLVGKTLDYVTSRREAARGDKAPTPPPVRHEPTAEASDAPNAPPGWYDHPFSAQKRYWDGSAWAKRGYEPPVSSPDRHPEPSIPPGWREDPWNNMFLRYWDGTQWTNNTASRPGPPPVSSVPAGWYQDNPSQPHLRYWDGSRWTSHTTPHPNRPAPAVLKPAGWYEDNTDPAQLRYWNGARWTGYLTPRPRSTSAPDGAESRVSMTSAEWQTLFFAWLNAGATEYRLWQQITNAQINDSDPATLSAQSRMASLTAEQGAQQIRRELEANPALLHQLRALNGPQGQYDQLRPRSAMEHSGQ